MTLSTLVQLQRLDMGIIDECAGISALPVSLTHLSLELCPDFNGRPLGVCFARLAHLRELRVGMCYVDEMERSAEVENMVLEPLLAGLTGLSSLELASDFVIDRQLMMLSQLSSLQHLHISAEEDVLQDMLSEIILVTGLQSIVMECYCEAWRGFSALSQLTRLQDILRIRTFQALWGTCPAASCRQPECP